MLSFSSGVNNGHPASGYGLGMSHDMGATWSSVIAACYRRRVQCVEAKRGKKSHEEALKHWKNTS